MRTTTQSDWKIASVSYDLTGPAVKDEWNSDINNDGSVDISDVILDLRIALGLDSPAPCSDINGDGHVDISDVILTLRMALGLDPVKACI